MLMEPFHSVRKVFYLCDEFLVEIREESNLTHSDTDI